MRGWRKPDNEEKRKFEEYSKNRRKSYIQYGVCFIVIFSIIGFICAASDNLIVCFIRYLLAAVTARILIEVYRTIKEYNMTMRGEYKMMNAVVGGYIDGPKDGMFYMTFKTESGETVIPRDATHEKPFAIGTQATFIRFGDEHVYISI